MGTEGSERCHTSISTMSVKNIIVCLAMLGSSMVAPLASDCYPEVIQKEFESCTNRFYTTYLEDFRKGSDGRPDFYERKSCNYMTAVTENCTVEVFEDCVDEEKLNKIKDVQVEGALENIEAAF